MASDDQQEDRRQIREMQTAVVQTYEAARQRLELDEPDAVDPQSLREMIRQFSARAEELAAKWPLDDTFSNAHNHAVALQEANDF